MIRGACLSKGGALAIAWAAIISPPLLFAHPAENRTVEQALTEIRMAALSGDTSHAEQIMAEDLVLVSQSGKVYGLEAALFDLGSGFSSWDNSDITISAEGELATVTLINRRVRSSLDIGEAAFRVMQIWRLRDGNWKLVAQSSVRLSD